HRSAAAARRREPDQPGHVHASDLPLSGGGPVRRRRPERRGELHLRLAKASAPPGRRSRRRPREARRRLSSAWAARALQRGLDLRRATKRRAARPRKLPGLPSLLQPIGGSSVKPFEPAPLMSRLTLAFAGSLLRITRQLEAGQGGGGFRLEKKMRAERPTAPQPQRARA